MRHSPHSPVPSGWGRHFAGWRRPASQSLSVMAMRSNSGSSCHFTLFPDLRIVPTVRGAITRPGVDVLHPLASIAVIAGVATLPADRAAPAFLVVAERRAVDVRHHAVKPALAESFSHQHTIL